jgi:hypothetical protein
MNGNTNTLFSFRLALERAHPNKQTNKQTKEGSERKGARK